jgi:DNA-binding NtrC family response regulator
VQLSDARCGASRYCRLMLLVTKALQELHHTDRGFTPMNHEQLVTVTSPAFRAPPALAPPNLIGQSGPMRVLYNQIERVAPTNASVLITGESGCGKELVAKSIHAASARAEGPFIAINCGAIPDSLIEAEMFGYEKGSFTGALRTHAGVFERADGGTLFLDEITEMPAELQTRLLRVLESSAFFRVGGTREIAVDVRIIAASNRDPLHAVEIGQLREDLLYRLAVFPIHVAPLRERGADLQLLAEHFLAELNAGAGTHKRFGPGALQRLAHHRWPGNVRELNNAIERAFILCDSQVEPTPITTASQNEPLLEQDAEGASLRIAVGSRLETVERSLIEATLNHFDGNKRRAASALGCSLRTLYNRLSSYNQPGQFAEL